MILLVRSDMRTIHALFLSGERVELTPLEVEIEAVLIGLLGP